MKPQELVESAARVTSNWSDSEGTVWPTCDTASSCENMCFADLLALADAAYVDFTTIHPGTNNGVKNVKVMSNGSDCEGTCIMPTFDTISSCKNIHFADLLALADTAYVNFTAIHPGFNNGLKNPFNPISTLQSEPLPNSSNILLSHHNSSLEQTSAITINDNPGEPQGGHTGCCRKTISQANKAMRRESRQVAGMQINLVEEEEFPSTNLDNNKTPNNQEFSEPVIGSAVAAASTPLKKNHNFDKGCSHGIDMTQSPLPEESNQNDSNGSSTRLHMGVTKRKHSASSAHANTSPMNLTGVLFPNVQNKTREESREVAGMQINVVKEKTIPGTKLDKHNIRNKQEPSELVIESSGAALSVPFKENHNPCRGGGLGIDMNQPPLPKGPRQVDSNSRRSGNLTAGLHVGAIKRKHSASIEHVDTRGMNLNGVHYNALHASQRMVWVQFPNIPKKRRTPNTSTAFLSPRKDAQLASYPRQDCRTQCYASSSECLISCRSKAAKVPVNFEAFDRATQRRPTKKRSRASTRYRDFSPLTTTRNCNILPSHFTKQLSNDVGPTFEPSPGLDASLSAEGPMSNRSVTSSLSPGKDVWLATYPWQDARTHRCASNSECLNCENTAAKVPVTFEATDRAIHDISQAFERILSLCESQSRLTKRRSRAPTRFCDFASLTIRNCDILPNHFPKQLSIADRQTSEPSPSLDALVAELCAPLTKKKRTMKKKTTASSLSPRIDVPLATYPQQDARTYHNRSDSKCLISCENEAAKVPLTLKATDRVILGISQAFKRILSLCESQTRRTKRRSGAPTGFRDFAILTTTENYNFLPRHFTKQRSNAARRTCEPSPGVDALVAETRAILTKKKRTTKKKTNPPVSLAHRSRNKMQPHHKCLSNSLDAAHLDELTEKFRHLKIVRDGAIRKPRPRPKS